MKSLGKMLLLSLARLSLPGIRAVDYLKHWVTLPQYFGQQLGQF